MEVSVFICKYRNIRISRCPWSIEGNHMGGDYYFVVNRPVNEYKNRPKPFRVVEMQPKPTYMFISKDMSLEDAKKSVDKHLNRIEWA